MRLLFCLLPLLFFTCEKEPRPGAELDCITEIESHLTFVEEGEATNCNFFVELYLRSDQYYYTLGSHCADINNPAYYACDGTLLCNTAEDKCGRYGKRNHYVKNLGFVEGL